MPRLPLAADTSSLTSMRPSTPITSKADLPLMQEWAYDFEKNELKVNEDGLPYLVYGNEALKIWLFWAVITQRHRWRANSMDYGTEIERFIGLPIKTAIKSSELERTIREAIEICDYVKRIKSIEISLDEGIVTIDVSLESIYKEGWVEISVKV